jgi:hypothetical protein
LWDKKEGWQAATPNPGATPAFSVNAGADLATPTAVPLYLDGTLVRGDVLPENITLAWSKVSGPGNVAFTTADYQDANATFSAPGIYVLRLSATASVPSSNVSDTTTVIVSQSYAEWAADNITGPFAGQQGQTQDPDHDGIVNLIEYATGGNPVAADSPVRLEYSGGTLTLRYDKSKLADPALTITPQFSTGLSGWTTELNGTSVQTTLESETGLLESWKSVYLNGGEHVFGRILVTLP